MEQLARADITDRALVEAVTRSRCFNEGATTLINWKGRAIAFLERKYSGGKAATYGGGGGTPDESPDLGKMVWLDS